jgi:glycosyltransferase involved in cell wall biosynthesis
MPHLTVLICTHNRVELLAKTLDSLNASVRPDGWWIDILVAANACSDGTHEYLERIRREPAHQGRLPLTWFAEPTPGKSFALNSALSQLTGDLVAFVDDDHRVDNAYLAGVCRAAGTYPDAALFCGRILPDWNGSEPAWVHHRGPYRIYPLPVPRFDLGDTPRAVTAEIAIPGGGNLFLRTGWIEQVGRFNTELGPTGHDLGGSEDMDWVLRALQLGALLQYVPDVVQYHYVDTSRLTLPYLIKKAYKRTASTILLDPRLSGRRVPNYLYRKLGSYVFAALTAIGRDKRRFFLVRIAATLGEIAGYRQRGKHPITHQDALAHSSKRHA